MKNWFPLQTYPSAFLIQCLCNHNVEEVAANITTARDHALQESFFYVSPMSNFWCCLIFFKDVKTQKELLKWFQAAFLQKRLWFVLPPCHISGSEIICMALPPCSISGDGSRRALCFFQRISSLNRPCSLKEEERKMCHEETCKQPQGKVVAERNLLIPGTVLWPAWGTVATLCCLILTYVMRNCFVSWLYKCWQQWFRS